MRPNTEVQFRHDTNMTPARSARMSVDQNNIQHIMSVLTDLYSDPMMAVIREYSTNALDSHIAAGVTRPIEVSLPGPFRRNFEVQDYGTGLSVDDLLNICSKYGYSTKRDNDNESGMLGLGFKAGLTYTDQFSVTAVKDGVKAIAIVKRDEDGAGVIDIVDTLTTTDPNGVLVKVAVDSNTLFSSRAKEFFRFWESGTVLVDGAEPKPVEGLTITDKITVVTDGSLGQDYVVMGNIGYGVGRRLSDRIPYGYNVVARVEMGEVNFTPNREALHYTPRTEAALARITSEVQTGVVRSAQAEIDKCATHYEAFMATHHWSRLSRQQSLTYKGTVVPAIFSNQDGWVYDTRAYRYAVDKGRSLTITHFNNGLFVTGYDLESVTTTVRRKVKAYIEENDLKVRYVMFSTVRVGGAWTEGLPEVDYSVIKAIKLNNGKNGKVRTAGEPIRYYQDGTIHSAPVDQIPGDKVVYSPAMDTTGISLSYALPGKTVVELARNRWEKFMRENKGTKDIDDALKQALADIHKNLSLAERIHIQGDRRRLSFLSNLDAKRIKDPALAELVKAYGQKVDDDRILHYRRVLNMIRNLEIPVESFENTWKEALDKYPLLTYNEGVTDDHIYEYVNHFYEKETA